MILFFGGSYTVLAFDSLTDYIFGWIHHMKETPCVQGVSLCVSLFAQLRVRVFTLCLNTAEG